MSKYQPRQTYDSSHEQHRLTDAEILARVEGLRVAHIFEAVEVGLSALNVSINKAVGRAGIGKQLYPNASQSFREPVIGAMDEATKADLAKVTQTDGFESVEALKSEQLKSQTAWSEALTGMQANLANSPTLPLDVDSLRATVANSYVEDGSDELEGFANDPVNATKELV